jgi:hypothetical protein
MRDMELPSRPGIIFPQRIRDWSLFTNMELCGRQNDTLHGWPARYSLREGKWDHHYSALHPPRVDLLQDKEEGNGF